MKNRFLFYVGMLLLPFLGKGQVVDTAAVRMEVDSLVKVCQTLTGVGNYTEALAVIGVAEKKSKDHFGEYSAEFAGCLYNQGKIFYIVNKFDKALPLYLKAKSIRKEVLGDSHIDYVKSLIMLSFLYSSIGELNEAEKLALEAKSIQEKVDEKDNKVYAASLTGLAIVYGIMDEDDKAELLFLEIKNIYEKEIGKNNTFFAQSLINLAITYKKRGEYDISETYYLEAKSIYEKILGNDNLEYATVLNNLANLYLLKKDIIKSELLYLEAEVIYEKKTEKESLDYAMIMLNLGNLYASNKEYERAEPYYLKSKIIYEKILGNKSLDYALNSDNIARLYYMKGDFANSEPLFLEALKIREEIIGKESDGYARTAFKLAVIYQSVCQLSKSEQFFLIAASIPIHILQKSATYLPSRELEKHIALYQEVNDAFLCFNYRTSSDSFRIASYNNALFYKGYALENAIRLEESMKIAPDSIRDIYSRYKGYSRLLAAELAKPVAERKHAIRLDSMSTLLEKVLLRAAPAFAEAKKEVQWQDVRDALQPGEAAIEFIHYRYSDKKGADSTLYSALVQLPGEAAPQFIPLFEARQLEALVNRENDSRANYIQLLYAPKQPDGLPSLYQLIWKPMAEKLQERGIKTVYYSPTGLLHRLNLAAITRNNSGEILSEQYRLEPMASTRQLAGRHVKATPVAPKSALIYGGLRYYMDTTAIRRANVEIAETNVDTTVGLFCYVNRGELRNDTFEYLPGTLKEASALYKLLTDRNISTTLRVAHAGSEESFKQTGEKQPSPNLLHIATHAFFYPDPKTTSNDITGFADAPVFKVSDQALIRSGLILAGANHAWNTKHPVRGMEDGILTAQEVSQMNLSNTELVVLSACETGLGDIKGNEGVYGLQRAFRIAGAKNVLMSLWKVPDDTTEKLMTRFYNNWLEENLPLRQAFEEAQNWLRGQKGYENPYYWAGFVLVGE